MFEIRWFESGKIPSSIESWFSTPRNGEYSAKEEVRSDLYLQNSEIDYLGIKIREGNLELKWMREKFETIISDNVSGIVEDWEKFSQNDSVFEKQVFQHINYSKNNPWIETKKERKQLKFEYISNEEFKPVNYLDKLGKWERKTNCGFLLEITNLTLKNALWWSLGIDIFGSTDKETLNSSLSWIFKSYPEKLIQENSYGYPKWILN